MPTNAPNKAQRKQAHALARNAGITYREALRRLKSAASSAAPEQSQSGAPSGGVSSLAFNRPDVAWLVTGFAKQLEESRRVMDTVMKSPVVSYVKQLEDTRRAVESVMPRPVVTSLFEQLEESRRVMDTVMKSPVVSYVKQLEDTRRAVESVMPRPVISLFSKQV